MMDEEIMSDKDRTDDLTQAAAEALRRARSAAQAKGLHPGRVTRRRSRSTNAARSTTRDPLLLGEQVERLVAERGWEVDVAAGAVMELWPSLVGPDVAAHAQPVTFTNGVLTVRAQSTAWATQLRLLQSSILGAIQVRVGPDVVTTLRINGPAAPSWSRGPRRAAGPGPRDTFG